MTQNQIRYWELEETKRANRTKEAETERANRMSESIGKFNAEVNRWNAMNAEKQASASQTNAAANYMKAKVEQDYSGFRKAEAVANVVGTGLKVASTIGGWIAALA